jgi:hypothetical protein
MKKTFPGYYGPTEEEFSELWADCLFVLDANVLLNLYRYSPETREELIGILEEISDRLWVPHQAAWEYHRNRLAVIERQTAAYDEIISLLQSARNKLENDLRSSVKPGRHPFIAMDDLVERVQNTFAEIQKELDELKQGHPDMFDDDPIRDGITDLLDEKVGPKYPSERLEDIYKEGKTRYERQIPPGYLDVNKGGTRQYGDLVLWFQIIDKARETEKDIILVTDDRKDDWWLRFKGQTIGPRPELVEEMADNAGISFHMYPADPFMEYANKHLEREVKQEAIEEVRDVRQREEEEGLVRAIADAELQSYYIQLMMEGVPRSQVLESLVEHAERKHEEALREEDKATREFQKFARIAPLSPTEDVQPIDADALRAASIRRRNATARREAWSRKHLELLRQLDRSFGS